MPSKTFFRPIDEIPAAELLTFKDAIDHLIDWVHESPTGATMHEYPRAVASGLNELQRRVDWDIYIAEEEIYFDAPYSTGTIQYDQATLTVTFTGATLPSWVLDGRLKINDLYYRPVSQPTASTLKLHHSLNPGQDVVAGTAYELIRNVYDLPPDVRSMNPPHSEKSYFSQHAMSIEGLVSLERHVRSNTSEQYYYGKRGDIRRYGQWAIMVQFNPLNQAGFRFVYNRHPRRLKIRGDEAKATAGTISRNGSDNAKVDGTGTQFSADMVGSVLRIGTDGTNAPDGIFGDYPYADQAIIEAVNAASGTGCLTLTAEIPDAYSGVKPRVSDPIDIHPDMLEAFYAACEWQLSRRRPSKERHPPTLEKDFERRVRQALETDQLLTPAWTPPSFFSRSAGFHIVTPSIG